MLLITNYSGNVLAAWSGEGHSLTKIYPNNPEIQTKYLQYEFSDDINVLRNPTAYKVIEGLNNEWSYELKTPTTEELFNTIRIKRDQLLVNSDWTQLPDSPFITEKKTEWNIYRQQLRDLPFTCDPTNPIWPIPPEK